MLTPEAFRLPFKPERKFQPEIKYTDPSLAPTVILRQTSEHLQTSFDLRRCSEETRHFLADQTLPFIGMAYRGFLANFSSLREIGRIDIEILQKLFAATSGLNTSSDPEDMEAFSYSIMTMGCLPSMANHPQLPKGFSKRGLMEPPATIGEYFNRMRELKKIVIGLAADTIKPANLFTNPQLCRTFYFFDVGGRITLRGPENERWSFEEVLGDIEIEF